MSLPPGETKYQDGYSCLWQKTHSFFPIRLGAQISEALPMALLMMMTVLAALWLRLGDEKYFERVRPHVFRHRASRPIYAMVVHHRQMTLRIWRAASASRRTVRRLSARDRVI